MIEEMDEEMNASYKKINREYFKPTSASDKNPYFRADVKFSNASYPVVGLCDTGATFSVVSADATILGKNECKVYPVQSMAFHSCNGEHIPVIGVTKLSIYDDVGRSMEITCYVLRTLNRVDVYLGFDILKNFQISFDKQNIILKSKGRVAMSLQYVDLMKFYNMSEVKILPKETKMVTAYGLGPTTQSALQLIDGTNNSCNIQVTSMVVDGDTTTVDLMVYNGSDVPVAIPVDTCIAQSQALSEKIMNNAESINKNFLTTITAGTPRRERQLAPIDWSAMDTGPISSTQKAQILKILEEFHFVFSRGPYDIGRYSGSRCYRVELTTPEWQIKKYVPVPQSKIPMVQEHIKELLQNNIIEPAATDKISTNIIVVKKKNGEARICQDSRSLNNIMRRTSTYRIPKIDKILQELAGNSFFSSLDLNSAFFQLPLCEEQRDLYTFQCPASHKVYRWVCTPFGSANISNTFQSILASEVFAGVENVHIYIDDITISTTTFEKHVCALREVFQRLERFNLTVKLNKCHFAYKEINCFGFKVNSDGFRPDETKVAQLRSLAFPGTKKKLKSHLASMNYYRGHVKKFAELAAPLYELSGDKAIYKVTPMAQKAWNELLKAFTDTILKAKPFFNGTFTVTTDASTNGIAGTLTEIQDGKVRIIEVCSQGLTPSQKSYAPSQLELLAVHFAITKFKPYLLFNRFKLITDNMSIFHVLSKIQYYDLDSHSTTARKILYIAQFQYDIEHSPGSDPKMLLTDLLSRKQVSPDSAIRLGLKPRLPLVTVDSMLGGKISLDAREHHLLHENDRENNINSLTETLNKRASSVLESYMPMVLNVDNLYTKISDAQTASPFASKMSKTLSQKDHPLYKIEKKRFGRVTMKILKYRERIYVPTQMVPEVLELAHHGHQSVAKTILALRNLNLAWPGVYNDTRHYVQTCNVCTSARSDNTVKDTVKTRTLDFITAPFEIIQVDITNIKDEPVLGAVDLFTKYTRFYPMTDQTGDTIAHHFAEILLDFQIPLIVQMDNGRNLNCPAVLTLLDTFNVTVRNISRGNSPANGVIERSFLKLQNELRLRADHIDPTDQQDIKLAIKLAEFAINASITTTGYTPFQMLYLNPTTTGPFRLPEISKTRYSKLPAYLKALYLRCQRLELDQRGKLEERLAKLEEQNLPIIRIKKGNLVKIKMNQRVGQAKKLFRPYSSDTYVVIDVISHARSALLERLEHSAKVRRYRIKVPIRHLKLVKSLDTEVERIMLRHDTEDEAPDVDSSRPAADQTIQAQTKQNKEKETKSMNDMTAGENTENASGNEDPTDGQTSQTHAIGNDQPATAAGNADGSKESERRDDVRKTVRWATPLVATTKPLRRSARLARKQK